MPIPAENIIMNHEAVGNSGTSSGEPSFMPPRCEQYSTIRKMTQICCVSM